MCCYGIFSVFLLFPISIAMAAPIVWLQEPLRRRGRGGWIRSCFPSDWLSSQLLGAFPQDTEFHHGRRWYVQLISAHISSSARKLYRTVLISVMQLLLLLFRRTIAVQLSTLFGHYGEWFIYNIHILVNILVCSTVITIFSTWKGNSVRLWCSMANRQWQTHAHALLKCQLFHNYLDMQYSVSIVSIWIGLLAPKANYCTECARPKARRFHFKYQFYRRILVQFEWAMLQIIWCVHCAAAR